MPNDMQHNKSSSSIPRSNGAHEEFLRERYANRPKVGATELIARYRRGQTNPVSLLHQLSQTLGFTLDMKETVTTGNVTTLYFAYCAVIDGVEYKTGMGINKKDAKTNAAQLAINDLIPVLENSGIVHGTGAGRTSAPPPLPVKEAPHSEPAPTSILTHERKKNPLEEQIRNAVKDSFTKLLEMCPEFSAYGSTVAAFVAQSSAGYEVVAIGTGSYNTKETITSNGRTVNDSHAVVTARRSLLRYLYRNLLLFFSKTTELQEKSIFQQNEKTKLLNLKSDVNLHLYINQLPKGAAQISPHMRLNPLSMAAWEVNNQMSLHLTIEGKVFSVLSSTAEQVASRVVSMSSTDKITQWQVVGFQGALLSHFMEPVYVTSILIGDESCTNPRGMEIAVNQRVDGITAKLPIYYYVHRPHISLIGSITSPGWPSAQRTLSINWSQGDISMEVVNGLNGKTVEESPFKSGPAMASRLCKAAMLSRFHLVVKEAQREDLGSATSYREAKMMAKPYQEAKSVLKAYLAERGFGSWVEKPAVCEQFST
ncbi:adenosine deaminase domain-containing protein 1 [Engraulis encrasicolus]|uniref:adenosine deaminase domain-containing protein 1 n=1 Tax=Engraulis encrasicolus TaxID=184585 RepID=UPI002FCE91C5